jgi:predicted ferric reductase
MACLLVASSLWVLQKVLWAGFILYRNLGSGPSCQASIVHYPQGGKDSENAVQLRVTVKRPWKVLPGQFVYITIPHGFGLIQAHPYMIAWVLDNETSLEQTIVLLVRTEQGFSSRLRLCSEATRVILDGPYGGAQYHRLSQYDKVLFMANGIGITSHLLSIRYLLMAHDDRTARVRRLSLVWFLETKGKNP